jgi:glycosyltransferase involved in cell wall biosynthesis
MKILHLIPSLSVGGAEMILKQLILHPLASKHESRVVSLGSAGYLRKELQLPGIWVDYLRVSNRNLLSLLRLSHLNKIIEEFKPDVIQSWMFHANVLTVLLVKYFKRTPVVWSLHQDIADMTWIKTSTRIAIKLGAVFSHSVPSAIISVSERSMASHDQIGYAKAKFVHIPNGFDWRVFSPNVQARQKARKDLGLNDSDVLIGFFARYHPMKDHQTFIKAIASLHQAFPRFHFVFCGQNLTPENKELTRLIKGAGIDKVVHLLGLRDDLPRLYVALDIYSTSSVSEGFPLTVGEAMACGVPCVVTDVGDSARLVDETGLVVPPRDSKALAMAWTTLGNLPQKDRLALGMAARRRVIDRFSIDKMVSDYYSLYHRISRKGNVAQIDPIG